MFDDILAGGKNLLQKVTGGKNPVDVISKGIKVPDAKNAIKPPNSITSSIGGVLGEGINGGGNKRADIPPAPKLTDFMSKLKTNSVSRQSHFYTSFKLPKILEREKIGRTLMSTMVNDVVLYIEQTSLPELALATVANQATGVNTEMPYDKIFGQVTMTFVCDQNMTIKSFFDRWIFSTMQTAGGVFEYYDNYVAREFPIVLTDANLNPVYMVVLYNAYPKLINDVYLAASGKDYNRVQVQMSYSQWRSYSILPTPQNLAKANSLVPGVIKDIAGMMGIEANFDNIPGIDAIGAGNILDILGKIGQPGGLKSAILNQAGGILSEMGKPYREQVMSMLPQSVRQIGGSAMGKIGSMVSKKFF